MTFSSLKSRVALGVQRDDVASATSGYGDFINDGLTEIQKLRSWYLCMRHVGTVTMLAGTSSIALPANFKEFVSSKSPVSVTNSTGSLMPVDLVTYEEQVRRSSKFPSDSVIRVFNTWADGAPILQIIGTALEDLVFTLDYFRFLPALSGDTDTNFFTASHPEMVIAKAKAMAFESINDPIAAELEQLFQLKFKMAAAADARAAYSGNVLRM